jgi:hypothetical protein
MKITLRDLFWIVAVVAILLAWSVSHRRMTADHARVAGESVKNLKLAKDTAAELNHLRKAAIEMKDRMLTAEYTANNPSKNSP